MTRLFVVRSSYLDELWCAVTEPGGLLRYRRFGPIALRSEDLLPSHIDPACPPPILNIAAGPKAERASTDTENAIALHGWLGRLPRTDARDNRFWTWMAHTLFADYTRQRWPLAVSDEKAASSIHDHWILRGQGRGALRRHALSRLWWAAELTYAPWETGSEYETLRCGDPYAFTRILLRNQNTFQQILERRFGGSQRILIAMLDTLRRFSGPVDDAVAWLGREVNLMCRYRDLSSLSYGMLVPVFEEMLRTSPAAAGRR